MRAGFKSFLLRIAATCLFCHPCVADEPPTPGGQRPGARDARRPNILLIFTDDQSYKTVSCYPEALPGVKTPNLDTIAANGIRFHGAFLGAWCMPSRATMLTGRLPHGVESMRSAEPYPASSVGRRRDSRTTCRRRDRCKAAASDRSAPEEPPDKVAWPDAQRHPIQLSASLRNENLS